MYLESCTGPLVRADWLGSTVWETITDLLQQPDRLREELRRRREEDSPTRAIAEQELGIAKRRHAEIPEEQDRLVEGYGKGLIRLMEPRMRTLQAELEELVERISELEGRLSRLELTEEQEAQAVRFAERVQQGLDNLTFGERQELMRLLVEDVICDRERVTIRTIIPADKIGEDAVLCTPIRGGRAGQIALGGVRRSRHEGSDPRACHDQI